MDSDGDRLLAALGYHVRWNSWGLELPRGRRPSPSGRCPTGYVVREADPSEYEQCWTVQEDAFLEWSQRERQPFDDWLAEITGRPGFEPWNLRVGHRPVRVPWSRWPGCSSARSPRSSPGWPPGADQRGRGMAQALLVDAFAVARQHGATRSELSTDSRTGALGLYEKVGMVVTSTWVNRGLVL